MAAFIFGARVPGPEPSSAIEKGARHGLRRVVSSTQACAWAAPEKSIGLGRTSTEFPCATAAHAWAVVSPSFSARANNLYRRTAKGIDAR